MKKLWHVFDALMFGIGVVVFSLWVIAKVNGGHFYLRVGPNQIQCTPVEAEQPAPASITEI